MVAGQDSPQTQQMFLRLLEFHQIDFLLTTQSLQSSEESFSGGNDLIQPGIERQSQDLHAIIKADTTNQLVFTADRQEKNIRPEYFPVLEDKKISDNQVGISSDSNIKKSQYAQLIGFGTKQAAQAFVTRLKKHNVPVILKTMMSKTASGKQKTWYQAITPTYDTAQELQDQVSKIKRLEHIRGNDIKTVYVK